MQGHGQPACLGQGLGCVHGKGTCRRHAGPAALPPPCLATRLTDAPPPLASRPCSTHYNVTPAAAHAWLLQQLLDDSHTGDAAGAQSLARAAELVPAVDGARMPHKALQASVLCSRAPESYIRDGFLLGCCRCAAPSLCTLPAADSMPAPTQPPPPPPPPPPPILAPPSSPPPAGVCGAWPAGCRACPAAPAPRILGWAMQRWRGGLGVDGRGSLRALVLCLPFR